MSAKRHNDDEPDDMKKTKARVRQFMNILEQLPRLCSPTICGTLSQPTTRTERVSRGADVFEWSLEQKAILSPADITTDQDGADEWHNAADLNPSWRQQESETFFSQRTIAPSPLITPSTRRLPARPISKAKFQDLMYDEEEEDEEDQGEEFEAATANNIKRFDNDLNDSQQAVPQDLSTKGMSSQQLESARLMSYEFDKSELHNNHDHDDDSDTDFDLGESSNRYLEQQNDVDENDNNNDDNEDDHMDDDLYFSPQPLKSSQTQQRMDIFSPDTFVRTMEDEGTLQSTPKTTGGSLQRARTRTRADVLD